MADRRKTQALTDAALDRAIAPLLSERQRRRYAEGACKPGEYDGFFWRDTEGFHAVILDRHAVRSPGESAIAFHDRECFQLDGATANELKSQLRIRGLIARDDVKALCNSAPSWTGMPLSKVRR